MRSHRSKLPFQSLFTGMIVGLGVGILAGLRGTQFLSHLEYQARFRLRGDIGWDERIVLIAIDDASLEQLGAFPWVRSRYVEMLEQLQPAQPSLIVFDLILTDASAEDERLAAALANHRAVVLAMAWDGEGRPLWPVPSLAAAAIGIGHIDQARDSDGLVRRVKPQIQEQLALGIVAAEALSLTLTPIAMPPLDRPLEVNWPGATQTLTTVSFVDVIGGQVDLNLFQDRVVIIGAAATGLDAMPTPFNFNPPAHGAHVHAAVLDNLFQQRWLRRVSLWPLLLILGPLAGLVFAGRSLKQQFIWLLGLGLGWIGLGMVLFAYAYWIPIVEPLLLFGLTAITHRVIQNIQQERRLGGYVAALRQMWASTLLFPQQVPPPPLTESASVTQLAELAEQLGRSQATQAAIARSLPMGLLAAHPSGEVWFCNPLASQWLAVGVGDTVMPRLLEWLGPTQWHQVQQGLPLLPQEIHWEEHWYELRLEPLKPEEEETQEWAQQPSGFVLLVADISYRKQIEMDLRMLNLTLEEQVLQRTQQLAQLNQALQAEVSERQQTQDRLAYEASHDVLTQLPNRKLFLWHLQQLLNSNLQQSNPTPFAVLFLDCDRFKLINDSFGHWVGDELLKGVATVLKDCVRPTDVIARFGGDEFTILLTNISGVEDAIAVSERIRHRFAQSLHVEQHQLFTNASIGIVICDGNYTDPDAILRDADIAMYQAKTNGLGYALFEPKMHQQVRRSLQTEIELRLALEHQEFCLHYQPILALQHPRILGCEALVRWRHRDLGLVSPSHFIPLAEETGLICALGRWVLQEACHQLRNWQRQGWLAEDAVISVNLSVVQFLQADLIEQIDAALQASELPGHCLKLEITETALMSNTDLAFRLLRELQQRGIKLSIDDFGTGYSSLGYLQRFPVDVLKIDQQFIHNIHCNSRQLGIVEAIIKLGTHLDMEIVAEGVEQVAQMEALRQLGCHFGQGHLFSKPLDAKDFLHHLQRTPAVAFWPLDN
jgi:diguanylate cyclase (GGDEF)-like protein